MWYRRMRVLCDEPHTCVWCPVLPSIVCHALLVSPLQDASTGRTERHRASFLLSAEALKLAPVEEVCASFIVIVLASMFGGFAVSPLRNECFAVLQ